MAGFRKPSYSWLAKNYGIKKAAKANSVCKKDKEHAWSELPSLPLENIYSFLSRTDQSRMSQVCRQWNREYGSPSVWRTIKFIFPDHIRSSDPYPEVKFARKYSSMCRNVEIVFGRVRRYMQYDIWSELKMFLEILTDNSRLTSLKLWNMEWYFRLLLNKKLYDPLFESIVELLNSQSSLKTVEFHTSRFSFYESVEVLKSLSEKNSATLQNLTLRGFVEDLDFDQDPDEKAIAVLNTILRDKLCNLKNLSTDYTQMFECLFPKFLDASTSSLWKSKLTTKRQLSNLTLFCKGRKLPRLRGLPPFFWKHMREWYPDLSVEMHFDPSSDPLRELEFFVPKFIPLKYINFGLYKNSSSETDLDAVLRHFLTTECTKHLETVFIVWLRPIPNLASVILPFFMECQKLKSFQLYTLSPLEGLDEMLKELFDSRPPSLQDILVSVTSVMDEEGIGHFRSHPFVPDILDLNTWSSGHFVPGQVGPQIERLFSPGYETYKSLGDFDFYF